MGERPRTGLRLRLCLTFTSIMALLMLGQAAYTGFTTSRESGASQRRVLQRDVERSAARLSTNGPVAITLAELRAEGLFRGDTTLRQFLGRDGTVLDGSDLLDGIGPLLPADRLQRVPASGTALTLDAGEGERPAYAVAAPTSPPIVVVAVARNDWAAIQNRKLLSFELVVIPLSIILGAALAWFTIGKQLRRLRSIVRGAEAVAAGDVSGLDPAGPKDELFAIATALTEITGSLRSAHDYQKRFAAQAAHELRTPLAIMKAETELALSAESLGEVRPALVSIAEETDKLAALVQDLLAFGASSAHAARTEDVAIRELVGSAAQPFVDAAAAKGVRLTLDLDPGSMRVSRVAIEHAIRNLLENAIRAAPAGSDVRVSASEASGWWHLAVEDGGPGVDPALGDRIFEPFVGRATNGHGLGLSFVKLIAEAHQGKASLERGPNGRTRFCLSIPVAPAALSR